MQSSSHEVIILILCVHVVILYRLVLSPGHLHQSIDPMKVLVIVTFKFHRVWLVIATHTRSNRLRTFFPPKVKPSSGLLISLSPKSVANIIAPIPFAVNNFYCYMYINYYRLWWVTFHDLTVFGCQSFLLQVAQELINRQVWWEINHYWLSCCVNIRDAFPLEQLRLRHDNKNCN